MPFELLGQARSWDRPSAIVIIAKTYSFNVSTCLRGLSECGSHQSAALFKRKVRSGTYRDEFSLSFIQLIEDLSFVKWSVYCGLDDGSVADIC